MASLDRPVNTAKFPPAFLCTASQQIMKDPVLALCGHLFDRSVLQKIQKCPRDGYPLHEVFAVPDLKQRIVAHLKPAQPVPEQNNAPKPAPKPAQPEEETKQLDFKKLSLFQKAATQEKKDATEKCELSVSAIKKLAPVHQDDIHGLIPIKNGFVSGSKDQTLKVWGQDGTLACDLQPSVQRGYKYWITALAPFSNDLWASGTRDGEITIWDTKGQEVSTLQYQPSAHSKQNQISKDRNKQRINCITELRKTDKQHLFYTGTPRFVQLWDGVSGKMVTYHEASQNDWVYCIDATDPNKLIVVIGSDVQIWDMNNITLKNKADLIEEDLAGKKQRPFISSILRMPQDQKKLATVDFQGALSVVDMTSQKCLLKYQEHVGRVWNVIEAPENLLATCADDRSIKLWDVRCQKSVCTLSKNPGRVSALLKIADDTLLSGSCPDNPYTSKEKASFTFWSIKQQKKDK